MSLSRSQRRANDEAAFRWPRLLGSVMPLAAAAYVAAHYLPRRRVAPASAEIATA